MRKKKWLFIVVGFLLLVNLIFYALVRWVKIDQQVKNHVIQFLENRTNATVEITDFDFNDQQLNISGFRINDKIKGYDVNIPQLYIKYNLVPLLLSRFKDFSSIEHIKIYQPQITYKFKDSSENASQSTNNMKLPQWNKFFQKVNIYDGDVKISYDSESLNTMVHWDSVDVAVVADKSIKIEMIAFRKNQLVISGDAALVDNNLSYLNVKVNDLYPEKLQTSLLDNLNCGLNLDINIDNNIAQFSGKIVQLNALKGSYTLTADSLTFLGQNNFVDIDLSSSKLDENSINGHVLLEDYLSDVPVINSEILVSSIPLNRYLEKTTGFVDAQLYVTGDLNDPNISGTLTSDRIVYAQEDLKEIKITGGYKDKVATFNLENAIWEENQLKGYGNYNFNKGLQFNISGNNFKINRYGLFTQGDLVLDVVLKDQLEVSTNYRSLNVSYNDIKLEELNLYAQLIDNNYEVALKRKYEDLSLSVNGSLASDDLQALIQFRQFHLTSLFENEILPLISGSVKIDKVSDLLTLDSTLRIFDRDYGKLSGTLFSEGFYDLMSKDHGFEIRTVNSHYNYEPFSLKIETKGNADHLEIDEFELNDEIEVSGDIDFTSDVDYNLLISGENLKIREYLRYFTDYSFYSKFNGSFNVDFTIDKNKDNVISGNVDINNLLYGEVSPINVMNLLTGDFERLGFWNQVFDNEENKLFETAGMLSLIPQFKLILEGEMARIKLQELLPESHLNGEIYSDFSMNYNAQNPAFYLNVKGKDISYNDFEMDSLSVKMKQIKDILYFDELDASTKNQFSFTGSGAIGYNFFTGETIHDDSQVELLFHGDLLKLLGNTTNIIEDAASDAYLQLNLSADDTGLNINKGEFTLKKGYLKIQDQQELLSKIKIDMSIENDSLKINNFSGELGNGKIIIKNIINNDENEFQFGSIKIGKLLVKTNKDGILMHMPLYMPGNSVSTARITGRDSEYLHVYGPFDNIRIIGDAYFANGSAIYPSRSENLLNLIRRLTTDHKSTSYDLPFTLDILMHFKDNIRYVTYPLNLTVDNDNFLHLEFNGEKFIVAEANFTSEEGTVDIFGSQLEAENVEVRINKFDRKVKIYGKFVKKVSDGTIITLEVSNMAVDATTQNIDNFAFNLTSDNSNDSQLDILALLRYGRRTEDISQSQQKTLLQDEMFQLVGLGIEGVFIDPLISPLENYIRQLLNLDFFYLQTDMIQNLFNRYSSDQTEYFLDEEGQKLSQSTTDIFLNNLSIGMGKYLSRKLFLNYELQFQKLQDLSVESDLGVYHNITVRYDLPDNFNLAYKYSILPFKESDKHEIRLEKTWRF